MTDSNLLATQVSQFLAPYIPYLLKGGLEMAKSAAGRLGELITEEGWEKAKLLWGKLVQREEVKKAAETVVNLPEDTDALSALRLQIKLAFAADFALAENLEKMMAEGAGKGAGNINTVTIGGDVKNSNIVIGNNNKVGK